MDKILLDIYLLQAFASQLNQQALLLANLRYMYYCNKLHHVANLYLLYPTKYCNLTTFICNDCINYDNIVTVAEAVWR